VKQRNNLPFGPGAKNPLSQVFEKISGPISVIIFEFFSRLLKCLISLESKPKKAIIEEFPRGLNLN
jgi:hypothetical protein